MSVDDLCVWWVPSRDQRRVERLRGEGDAGTMMYEIRGCYQCNGFNDACKEYIASSTIDQPLSRVDNALMKLDNSVKETPYKDPLVWDD